MRDILVKILFAGLFLLIFLSVNPHQVMPVYADTSHCGTINSDEIWSSGGNVHVIDCSVTVAVGVTLTISEGTIIKFKAGTRLLIDGALKVLGTSGNPVYFTSYADDTVGGDTNGNGASTGSQGNWSDIRFTDTSDDANSLIDYAIIRYGGDNYLYNLSGAVTLLDASPTISYTQIYQNEYAGILASGSQPKLTCNDIYLNSNFGIYNQTTATVVDASNQWWGASSGPYHETSNPNGEGNTVTDGVNFIPWRLQPCTLPPEPEKLKVFLPLTIRD